MRNIFILKPQSNHLKILQLALISHCRIIVNGSFVISGYLPKGLYLTLDSLHACCCHTNLRIWFKYQSLQLLYTKLFHALYAFKHSCVKTNLRWKQFKTKVPWYNLQLCNKGNKQSFCANKHCLATQNIMKQYGCSRMNNNLLILNCWVMFPWCWEKYPKWIFAS